jgi:UDPglucose 6-dehydrogenase
VNALRVSVIGLGKLGSPLAAVIASKGHTVVGADVNTELVRLINERRAPVPEPGLQTLIDGSRERLTATTDVEAAVANTDLTHVIVPTPSGPDGRFSLRFVLDTLAPIGAALRRKTAFHVVSLTSTVMPGDTSGTVLPALEKASGRGCGVGFGLCYNPEFIALGNVVEGLLYPDFLLIGESDARSGQILEEFYATICERRPPVARMAFVNAELTKLSVNTFVTTKISYANMLAQVCEALPGSDVDVVTRALGLDRRIGEKYLRGATGYGGPCFPRDNVAFAALARGLGRPAALAEATDQVNRTRVGQLEEWVKSQLRDGACVGVLGLSYKPATPVVEESQSLELARRLADSGTPVVVHDPMAMASARAILGERVAYAASADECARLADVLVIATPWDAFRRLSPEAVRPGTTLLDCWRILPPERFAHAAYAVLGRGR